MVKELNSDVCLGIQDIGAMTRNGDIFLCSHSYLPYPILVSDLMEVHQHETIFFSLY